MKTRFIYLVFLTILTVVLFASAEERPHYRMRTYWEEDWRGESFHFGEDAYPDTGLFAITDKYSNEPMFCYPFHSGHVSGLSDTVEFVVHFKNRNSEAYDISSLQPEAWFTPVLYRVNDNPRKRYPIADTSNFDCSFQYWQNGMLEPVAKPQSIPSVHGSNTNYFLVYYAWNLPVGTNRLMMKTTSAAPEGVRSLVSNHGLVWVIKPVDLGDTLNAYGACFWWYLLADEDSSALAWTDTMLTYNPYSIPGYLLKAYAHSDLGDSLLKVTALDSAIAIAERYGDPVVPDSSDMNHYWKLWYGDILNHAKYYRWKHISGNQKASNL